MNRLPPSEAGRLVAANLPGKRMERWALRAIRAIRGIQAEGLEAWVSGERKRIEAAGDKDSEWSEFVESLACGEPIGEPEPSYACKRCQDTGYERIADEKTERDGYSRPVKCPDCGNLER